MGFKVDSSDDEVTVADLLKALLPIIVATALKLYLLGVMRRAMIRAAIQNAHKQQS